MKKLLFILVSVSLVCLCLASCKTSTCTHEYSEWTVETAATCTTKGVEKRTCKLCNAEETRETELVDHSFGEWTTVKEATCIEKGSEERVCSVCQEKETREIELTEHSYGEWTTVTAASKGVKGLEERECSVCKNKETREVEDTGVYTDENWTVSGEDKYAFQYVDGTIVNKNTEVMNNENHYDVGHVNMNVYETEPAEFYKMSVKIKGTITPKVTGDNDVYAGVLLSYFDENNYVAFVVRWTTWDRNTEIRSIYFIQVIDGVYTNLGDNWTDGCSILPSSAIYLTVVKSLSLNGVVFDVTLSAKGGTYEKSAKATYEKILPGKVGLIGANDEFVYSEFTVTENTDVVKSISYACGDDTLTLDYYNQTYTLTGSKASTGNYELTGKTVVLTPTEGDKITATIKDDNTFEYYVDPGYTIEYTLLAGESKTVIPATTSDYTVSFGYIGTKAAGFSQDDKVGVKVWYVDENNYLDAYVQWGETRGGRDEVRELSINGYIGGQFTDWYDCWCDNCTNLPCDGGLVTVTKEGKTFTITMTANGVTKVGTRTFDNLPDGKFDVKTYASGTDFSFYDVAVKLDAEKQLNLDLTGDFTVDFDATGTIAGTVTNGVVTGLQLYSDGDNYLKVYAAWETWDRPEEIRNLEICGRMNGDFAALNEWNDAFTVGCGLHPCDTIHYTITRTGNLFTMKITCGEYSRETSLDVTNFNSGAQYTASIYVVGDNFTLTHLTVA